ncbi:Heat stress transcription factor [Seminavis robusta]|uniref:Heat stress transcription factor n=1 Tax=Seminavis robusta TaxID=568900 RepID=A0A9N8EA79_9STRA|nr:Heat stress transcription factor [Seminavis robusta]|eukprot:Sro800_g204320.1 Heat stress transcription factor (351) ;mRNA; r:26793-28038
MVAKQQQPPRKATATEPYRDHSHLTDDDKDLKELMNKADQEGVKGTDQSFPVKLHQLLSGSEEDGFAHIVSWQPHGRSFIVKKHADFVEKVLPCCFRQTRFASFQRQLNLYGFRRITQGRDKGGYYHELFLRGRGLLALKMQRTKVKGTGARKAAAPETEPDFWSMSFVFDKKAAAAPKPPPPAAASPVATMPAAATSPSFSPASVRQSVNFPRLAAAKPSPSTYTSTFPTSLVGLNAGGLSTLSPNQLAGGHLLPSAASFLGQAATTLPDLNSQREANETRRAMIEQMIAMSSRLQSLRETNRNSFLGTSGNSASLQSNALLRAGLGQPQGPLHLNSFGRACTCAIPAF